MREKTGCQLRRPNEAAALCIEFTNAAQTVVVPFRLRNGSFSPPSRVRSFTLPKSLQFVFVFAPQFECGLLEMLNVEIRLRFFPPTAVSRRKRVGVRSFG